MQLESHCGLVNMKLFHYLLICKYFYAQGKLTLRPHVYVHIKSLLFYHSQEAQVLCTASHSHRLCLAVCGYMSV